MMWFSNRVIGPFVASALPVAAAIAAMIAIDRVKPHYEDRELPLLTEWLFNSVWAVPLLFLPAFLCGLLSAFVIRRIVLYGPYVILFIAPLVVIIAAFGFLIVAGYAEALME
jgi:hypothetical protein